MNELGIWYHITTVISLLVFKLAVLFVGYLIAKLGFDLLVKGVTGEFKFQTKFKDSTADLISASPGLFFILMATILIAIGILKDKPFETKVTKLEKQLGVQTSAESAVTSKNGDIKPPVPKISTEQDHDE